MWPAPPHYCELSLFLGSCNINTSLTPYPNLLSVFLAHGWVNISWSLSLQLSLPFHKHSCFLSVNFVHDYLFTHGALANFFWDWGVSLWPCPSTTHFYSTTPFRAFWLLLLFTLELLNIANFSSFLLNRIFNPALCCHSVILVQVGEIIHDSQGLPIWIRVWISGNTCPTPGITHL